MVTKMKQDCNDNLIVSLEVREKNTPGLFIPLELHESITDRGRHVCDGRLHSRQTVRCISRGLVTSLMMDPSAIRGLSIP